MDEADTTMIQFIGEVVDWFQEPGRWLGDDGILPRTLEHLALGLVPMALALLVALPLSLWMGHRRLGKLSTNAIVNLGRAIPSFGLIVVAGVFFLRAGVGLRFWPAVAALFILAIPPIFTNAYVAITVVPAAMVEAGRGMGLTEKDILWGVEVPVGAPVILGGIRISLIQVLATVPLAAVLSSGGGLGQYVVRGFSKGASGTVEVFAGALLIAVLTIAVDRLFSVGESLLLPDGVRRMATEQIRAAASIS
jgi:osmoprotectant transport system permease protein